MRSQQKAACQHVELEPERKPKIIEYKRSGGFTKVRLTIYLSLVDNTVKPMT